MKKKQPYLKSTTRAGSATALTLLACLALPLALAAPPEGKGGGKGGGGGGGDDGDGGSGGSGWEDTAVINEVPPIVASPVQYELTEILWPVENHNGVILKGVNRDGFVVAFGKLPSDPDVEPERRGLINWNPDGSAGATFVDINDIFTSALQSLNSNRSDGPWRIAYAHEINDDGLVACMLLAGGAPRPYDTDDAANLGIDPVPVLIAVADLNDPAGSNALVLIEEAPDPDWEPIEITTSGPLFVAGAPLASSAPRERTLYRRSIDPTGKVFYNLETLPQASGPVGGITDSLLIAQTEWDVPAEGTDQLVRYSVDTGASELLWESEGKSLWASGIAEDGTIYVDQFYRITSGKGRKAVTETYSTPFHVLPDAGDSGERTPITSDTEYANIHNWNDYVSRASLPGEEEVVVYVRDANGIETMQIYKPNFKARFVTPIPVTSKYGVEIASPYYGEVASTVHDHSEPFYNGGYIAYGGGTSVFLLTPQPVQ